MGLKPFSRGAPSGHAWKNLPSSILKKVFGVFDTELREAASLIDVVAKDAFADTTNQLDTWEREFGLRTPATELERRQQLDFTLRSDGGQSLEFIQDTLQAAGFNVWVHSCWVSENPFVVKDPRAYIDPPEYGTELCTDNVDWNQPQCTDTPAWGQAQANGIVGGTNYFDNITLQDNYLPPVPDDPDAWPFFLYIGGQVFPQYAQIDMDRYDELRRLICKHRPLRHWIVLMVQGDPVPPLPEADILDMDEVTDSMDNEVMS
jgi:hypothetical protein